MPSTLGSAPVPPAAKYLHNMILPPPYFTVRMVFSGSLFFLQMAKQFSFSFIRPQDISPEIMISVSVCICKLSSGFFFFLCGFWNIVFFLAAWSFSPCPYRTCFSSDFDTLLPASVCIFTRFFAFFIWGWYSHFPPKARSSLGHRTRFLPDHYDG